MGLQDKFTHLRLPQLSNQAGIKARIEDQEKMSRDMIKPKNECAPSEDSDQPGHPPSLISLCCPHEESLGPQLPIKCTVKTLIRLGGCPG